MYLKLIMFLLYENCVYMCIIFSSSSTNSSSIILLQKEIGYRRRYTTRLRPGRFRVGILAGTRDFSPLKNLPNGSGAHLAPCAMGTEPPSLQ